MANHMKTLLLLKTQPVIDYETELNLKIQLSKDKTTAYGVAQTSAKKAGLAAGTPENPPAAEAAAL